MRAEKSSPHHARIKLGSIGTPKFLIIFVGKWQPTCHQAGLFTSLSLTTYVKKKNDLPFKKYKPIRKTLSSFFPCQ
jgi:hypothetical protein